MDLFSITYTLITAFPVFLSLQWILCSFPWVLFRWRKCCLRMIISEYGIAPFKKFTGSPFNIYYRKYPLSKRRLRITWLWSNLLFEKIVFLSTGEWLVLNSNAKLTHAQIQSPPKIAAYFESYNLMLYFRKFDGPNFRKRLAHQIQSTEIWYHSINSI